MWIYKLYVCLSVCVNRLAVEAIRGVHPGVVTMALNNCLWSVEEEALLARIASVSCVRGAVAPATPTPLSP